MAGEQPVKKNDRPGSWIPGSMTKKLFHRDSNKIFHSVETTSDVRIKHRTLDSTCQSQFELGQEQ